MSNTPWIIWAAELESGHAVVDGEHKALVTVLNELHVAVSSFASQSHIGEILHRLVDHVAGHFTREESLLLLRDLPDFSGHQREHAYFLNRLRDYQLRLINDREPITLEILELFKNWLLRHIREADLRDLSR